MTTILADAKLGVMVADSNFVSGDRAWSGRKVHRVRGALIGLAGNVPLWGAFLAWFKAGMPGDFEGSWEETDALVLDGRGLWLFDVNSPRLQRVAGGREAIGTGAVAAIAAHEALGYTDPRKAVQIACRHDAASRPPVRVHRL